ncbi:hypothetical protein SAMN05444359_11383 [Neolewinella agarilytica]|uniref:Uncharacterized protein n=1 Tax=Neolewinella agarilytica TaxID=478744 RepID=A0A1H9HSN5_9BACT|nr:hypothetical protein SAMN05444359_11383 [Neolewinella agarilytica]
MCPIFQIRLGKLFSKAPKSLPCTCGPAPVGTNFQVASCRLTPPETCNLQPATRNPHLETCNLRHLNLSLIAHP